MAKWVGASLPAQEIDVKTTGIEFNVHEGDDKLGRLRVGKAKVKWIEKDSTYGKTLTWEKLAELFDQYGQTENE